MGFPRWLPAPPQILYLISEARSESSKKLDPYYTAHRGQAR